MLIPGCGVNFSFLLLEDTNNNYVIPWALFGMWGFIKLSKSKTYYFQLYKEGNIVSGVHILVLEA